MAIYRKPETRTVTILNGATVSDVVQLRDYVLAGLIFTTMTSSAMTFLASDLKDGTYVQVRDTAGVAISITVNSDTAVAIHGTPGEAMAPWNFIKLVGGTMEAADRTILLALK